MRARPSRLPQLAQMSTKFFPKPNMEPKRELIETKVLLTGAYMGFHASSGEGTLTLFLVETFQTSPTKNKPTGFHSPPVEDLRVPALDRSRRRLVW